MNLGNLIKHVINNKPIIRHSSNISKLETGNGVFNTSQDLYGDDDYTYYVGLIDLFDRSILEDDLHQLSIEQQKILEQYFLEAKSITPSIDENIDLYIYDFFKLTKPTKRLDEFLGSYVGEDNGQYSRFRKKQLYS